MAVTAKRAVTITYTGDVGGTQDLEAADNTSSPGEITHVSMSGSENAPDNQTVTVPTGATAVTITKDSDNLATVLLKGDAADVGIILSLTDPDSISLHANQSTIILASEAVLTVRLYWS